MTQEDERFLRQLLSTFQVEAQEHLAAMSSLLLRLERAPREAEATQDIETLFREAHSLKGAARSVSLADIERVCQALERVLSAMKRQEVAPSSDFFDAAHRAVDGVSQMLAQAVEGAGAVDAGLSPALARALDALLAAPPGEGAAVRAALPGRVERAPVTAAPVAASDTVRVATAKLEALMTQAEELQAFKHSGGHLAEEVRSLRQTLAEWKSQVDKTAQGARSLRRASAAASDNGVDVSPSSDEYIGRSPEGMPAGPSTGLKTGLGAARRSAGPRERMVAQLIAASERDELLVKTLLDRAAQLERAADRQQRGFGSRVDRLQSDMRQALMLPFATLLTPLPRLVRDLAQASGKDVEIVMEGASLETDRRILEQMKTPLVHLIRNAVDHGIEMPAQRARRGKAPRGRISIDIAAREGNKVEMLIADDGAGISLEQVRQRAERMGLLDARGAEWPAQRIADLVFTSGLSTSPILTDLSGHGLGLAIVREKIEALGGSIVLQPPPEGIGTRFCIVLPATLATFRGLLVMAAQQCFVLPSQHVERVGRVPATSVARSDEGDSIVLAGQAMPLVSLAAALELAPRPLPPAQREPQLQLVVATSGDKRIAFAVDEVLGDQEVLVKQLTPPLRRVRNIAGATVLGAGRLAPLVNVADLLKTAALHGARGTTGWPPAAAAATRASLLLAEDSITSRQLLKDILESAGYRVTTAADGIDALTSLQAGDYDLLVSDVEMPRLDGFGLTARVRSDKRLAELPVVLVTALDSREDKERGVEVGANAYIVKSGFDQRRLLDTIRALV